MLLVVFSIFFRHRWTIDFYIFKIYAGLDWNICAMYGWTNATGATLGVVAIAVNYGR